MSCNYSNTVQVQLLSFAKLSFRHEDCCNDGIAKTI